MNNNYFKTHLKVYDTFFDVHQFGLCAHTFVLFNSAKIYKKKILTKYLGTKTKKKWSFLM